MSRIAPSESLGALVAERPSRARVLEKYGLDYCCGGRTALDTACAARAIPLETVLTDLNASDERPEPEAMDWSQASLTELAEHVERTHHAYLRAELPRLTALIEKVTLAHSDRHPWLADLRARFAAFREALEQHMHKEERVLFPLCRRMERGGAPLFAPGGTIAHPIHVMMAEHDDAGEDMAAFRQLTGDYTLPEGACNTFRAMLDALATLERDMHTHVHLENNLLFPKALERERLAR